jgi:hypothetical protein
LLLSILIEGGADGGYVLLRDDEHEASMARPVVADKPPQSERPAASEKPADMRLCAMM